MLLASRGRRISELPDHASCIVEGHGLISLRVASSPLLTFPDLLAEVRQFHGTAHTIAVVDIAAAGAQESSHGRRWDLTRARATGGDDYWPGSTKRCNCRACLDPQSP